VPGGNYIRFPIRVDNFDYPVKTDTTVTTVLVITERHRGKRITLIKVLQQIFDTDSFHMSGSKGHGGKHLKITHQEAPNKQIK
jgi:hypothetical protein